MTIALAMDSSDGAVVAADSQFTQGDYKLTGGKISSLAMFSQKENTTGSCMVTGAGHGQHLSRASEPFRKVFKTNAAKHGDELRDAMSDALEGFYSKYLAPFHDLPWNERPSIEMIIACVRDGHQSVWVTDDAGPIAAVGSGAPLAMSIMTRLQTMPLMDVHATVIAAGYVVRLVKETEQYCGKSTDIAFMVHNRSTRVHRGITRSIDSACEAYEERVERMVLRHVLGDQEEDETAIPSLRTLFAEIKNQLPTTKAK